LRLVEASHAQASLREPLLISTDRATSLGRAHIDKEETVTLAQSVSLSLLSSTCAQWPCYPEIRRPTGMQCIQRSGLASTIIQPPPLLHRRRSLGTRDIGLDISPRLRAKAPEDFRSLRLPAARPLAPDYYITIWLGSPEFGC